jgi:hypothetical protein
VQWNLSEKEKRVDGDGLPRCANLLIRAFKITNFNQSSINSNPRVAISADAAAPLHTQKSVHHWHLPDDLPCVVATVQ